MVGLCVSHSPTQDIAPGGQNPPFEAPETWDKGGHPKRSEWKTGISNPVLVSPIQGVENGNQEQAIHFPTLPPRTGIKNQQPRPYSTQCKTMDK